MCIIDCLSTIVFILPLHLDYTKVIILILWWRNFQLEYWRTFQLVSTDIAKHPYTGIGKPESLKYDLSGKWSRRINSEHRIIYSVNDEIITVYVLSMRYHYGKK